MFRFSPERLKAAREGRDLSREALAAAAGTSYPALLSYEDGRRTPPRDVLLRLARALDVHPSALCEPDLDRELIPAAAYDEIAAVLESAAERIRREGRVVKAGTS